MACIQLGFTWSSDTPNTVKFLFLYWLYAFTTFGFSIRQGLHQLAQKSTNTYFPLKEESVIAFPSTSFWVKSIACVPTWPTCAACACACASLVSLIAFSMARA